MLRCTLLVSGLCFAAMLSMATSAEPSKSEAEVESLMCERGKLLLSDDFDKPLGKAWKVAKGKWDVANGAIQGSELKSDMHGAVIRSNLPLHNAVIQYSFKLQGAKTTSFSINDAKGHNSRVSVTAAGFTARKDDHDHDGPDKAVVLEAVKTPISAGEWHTLIIEIQDAEFLARLDGQHIAYGSHDAINVDKTNIGLTVGGESVSFKNLRIWEATPKADWKSTKAKLVTKSK